MKQLRKKILVPVDFSEASLYVAKQSLKIADFIEGQVVILYVIEKGDFFQEFFKTKDEIERVYHEVQKKLISLVDELKKGHNCDIDFIIESGTPSKKITETGYNIKARFILLARNSNLKEAYVGINTTRILAEAKNPVLTLVKQDNKLDYKKIVVPLDITKETRIQTFNAIAFASYYGSSVHLVSVVSNNIKYRKSRIYSKIKKAYHTIKENGITCTFELFRQSEGPLYQPILNYSHKIGSDLIMLMTHQENYSSDSYIGAFVQHIILESDIPVITLTSAAAFREGETLIKPVVDPLCIFNPETEKRRFILKRNKTIK